MDWMLSWGEHHSTSRHLTTTRPRKRRQRQRHRLSAVLLLSLMSLTKTLVAATSSVWSSRSLSNQLRPLAFVGALPLTRTLSSTNSHTETADYRSTRRSLALSRSFRNTANAYRKYYSPGSIITRTMTTTQGNDDASTGPSLQVAMLQFPVTHDKTLNHQTAQDYLVQAVQAFSDDETLPRLVVLPEIWNSPYATTAFPEYAEDLSSVPVSHDTVPTIDQSQAPTAHLLQQWATQHNIYLVGGSIPEKRSSTSATTTTTHEYYNTCLVFSPSGHCIAKHAKVHLFDIDVKGKIRFMESETLSPGTSYTYFDIPVVDKSIRVGIGICYDIRFAEYAQVLCQELACQILVYPGAFNMVTGPAHWELLQRARAVDNQCFVVTASPARTVLEEGETTSDSKYPHYTAWGHSTAVSPWGDVMATTDETPGIVTTQLELDKLDEVRSSIPISRQRRPDLYKIVKTD